ncbi:MAG: hypothetical protein BMS9Abin17_0246 [Acidimicrobiia bacterium]|nr:MAG: hypothetical protein BMS9Abin17_0246 [Acidimicrobiia bacterium]
MKGRPFLGVISGFFFGLFGAATLFLFGVIPLDSHLIWILPILGIVLGLFMATLAPFGSGAAPETATTEGVTYASAGDAEEAAPSAEDTPQATASAEEPTEPTDS